MSKPTAIQLSVVGLLVAGAWGVLRLEAQRDSPQSGGQPGAVEEPNDSRLSQAERRELQRRILDTVRERGTVESASTTTVLNRVPGTSIILYVVKDGAKVRKGEVIVRLDDSALKEKFSVQQIVLAKVEAELKLAKSRSVVRTRYGAAAEATAKKALDVAKLARRKWQDKNGEHALRLETATAEIRIAEAKMQAARNQMKREGADVDKARVALVEAESALKVAMAKRKLITGLEREYQSARRDLDVLHREAELLEIQQRIGTSKSSATGALRAAESALAVAKRGLSRLQRDMENCKIRAPRDGTAIRFFQNSRRSTPVVIEEGVSVRERQRVIQIVDLDRLRLRLRVHDSKIKRVRKGQPVTIRIDALPKKNIRGTVHSVSDVPEKGDWPNTDMTVYTVIVSIDRPTNELKIGLNAEAEIDVSKANR